MRKVATGICALLLIAAIECLADEFTIETPVPVIYLAHNLDESQNLGWCIDTIGRGYAEELHVHSCKPQGGDVQFTLLVESNLIQSVAFSDKCMTLIDKDHPAVQFGLRDCDKESDRQKFQYDAASKRIQFLVEPGNCVVVGEKSRSAGPFMSRDLLIKPCDTAQAELAQWIIKQ